MNIGIDAFPLSGKMAGIGRYVLEICKIIDKKICNANFYLYSPKQLKINLPSKRWHAKIAGNKYKSFLSSYGWLKLCVKKMAEKDNIDIFWSTRTILPSSSDRFYTISTVHDLNYKIVPESMSYTTLLAHRLWFKKDLERADIIVTNSKGTLERLKKITGIHAKEIARPGVSSFFKHQEPENYIPVLKLLGVKQPFFLSVGTIEPRKNISTLIESFISLKSEAKINEYSLVIVGGRGWRDRQLRSQIEAAKKFGVLQLGYVTDEELVALYCGAKTFVFPSTYEGFGIPALEARVCGTVLLASDIPELHESGGPDGIYVSPTFQGLREGLLLASKKPLPTPFISNGWEDAANVMVRNILQLYNFKSKSSNSK